MPRRVHVQSHQATPADRPAPTPAIPVGSRCRTQPALAFSSNIRRCPWIDDQAPDVVPDKLDTARMAHRKRADAALPGGPTDNHLAIQGHHDESRPPASCTKDPGSGASPHDVPIILQLDPNPTKNRRRVLPGEVDAEQELPALREQAVLARQPKPPGVRLFYEVRIAQLDHLVAPPMLRAATGDQRGSSNRQFITRARNIEQLQPGSSQQRRELVPARHTGRDDRSGTPPDHRRPYVGRAVAHRIHPVDHSASVTMPIRTSSGKLSAS